MDPRAFPQSDSQAQADTVGALDKLAELAEAAANNPQTGAPVRELLPLLVAVVRQHAETIVLLGA